MRHCIRAVLAGIFSTTFGSTYPNQCLIRKISARILHNWCNHHQLLKQHLLQPKTTKYNRTQTEKLIIMCISTIHFNKIRWSKTFNHCSNSSVLLSQYKIIQRRFIAARTVTLARVGKIWYTRHYYSWGASRRGSVSKLQPSIQITPTKPCALPLNLLPHRSSKFKFRIKL